MDQSISYYKEFLGGSIDTLCHAQRIVNNSRQSLLIANTHAHSSYKQYIFDVKINENNRELSLSPATPLSLPERCSYCNVISNENIITVYSGLESGDISVTSINIDNTSINQWELGQTSPVSSISTNSYTGDIIIGYEDGIILRRHDECHQDSFRPEHGCLAICSYGANQILATSTQSKHALSLYDENNQCVFSIPHPQSPQYFSCITVNPFNNNEIVCGSSDGQVIGYDLRSLPVPCFSYQAHSDYITDIQFNTDPVPSILSCSFDGSVYQRSFDGCGRVILSKMGCFTSCVLDPLLGFVAAGDQSGHIVIAHPV